VECFCFTLEVGGLQDVAAAPCHMSGGFAARTVHCTMGLCVHSIPPAAVLAWVRSDRIIMISVAARVQRCMLVDLKLTAGAVHLWACVFPLEIVCSTLSVVCSHGPMCVVSGGYNSVLPQQL
jgi:hypothetical protein